MNADVCVVGGGPAGLAAAIHAAKRGARTVVLERNGRAGVKLLTTGGGHCNVSNTLPITEWPARFGRRGRFIVPALRFLPPARLRDWFSELGQPLTCMDGFHLYPESRSAAQVRDALAAQAASLGVRILYDRRVDALAVENRCLAAVRANGENYPCRAAIVACGGASYPATGSTWDGCRLAEAVGHRIVPPVPGLVGLRASNLSSDLAGLVLPDALVRLQHKGAAAETGRGELLLTHTGVSGPAVLDLSASTAAALAAGKNAALTAAWRGDMDTAAWTERLAAWRRRDGGASLPGLLREFMPFRLAKWLCDYAGAESATPATLTAGARDRLAAALGAFPVAVTASEGWDRAMITRGGVAVRELVPDSMASTLVDGLYFAGETVDIDGPCGGYNLHWAFASGGLAGDAAAGLLDRGAP